MPNDNLASTVGPRDFGDALPVLMWMTDAAGASCWVNAYWTEFTGHPRSADMALGRWECIHVEDVEMVQSALELARDERDAIELEYRLRTRAGDYRWVLDRAVPRLDATGEYLGHVGVGLDITHQYEYRRRLQEREQALRQLHEVDERERAFYAGAVHDGMLQDVIGAEMLLQSLPGAHTQPLSDKTVRIRQALKSAIAHGRRLIGELRPMILDEQGLSSAVKFYAMEIENRSRINIRVDASFELDPPQEIWEGNVFRIVQEALNNIELHSESTAAAVRLWSRDGDLWVEVEDFGNGFDVDAVQGSFGLRRMRERAEIYGGTLAVQSSNAGTRVTLNMPLQNAAK